MRKIYQCPNCKTYLDEADTDMAFAMCRTCYQTWELETLPVVKVRGS